MQHVQGLERVELGQTVVGQDNVPTAVFQHGDQFFLCSHVRIPVQTAPDTVPATSALRRPLGPLWPTS